ncbi:MAG: hypothetical protein QNJ00_17245 [Woeseiaceae bacterium]|nr:hypothetical protein [Woeseiaceae bacterium]
MKPLCRDARRVSTWRLPVLLAAVLLAPARLLAAPGDILFSDNFEDGTLAPWTTTNGARSGVSNQPGFAGGGVFGAFTRNDPVTVTSPAFNANVPEARLDVWVRRGADFFSEDTDTNEDFVLEYRRADNTWVPLRTWLGSGANGQVFTDSFILPPDALHGALAIRFRQTAGSGFDFDYWHFDDIVVTEIAAGSTLGVGSCDDFESGLTTNWTINSTTGFAGISAATSSSPVNSLYLNGGIVEVTSNVIDTSGITFGDLTVWIRRGSDVFSENPDGTENLVVEYLDDLGTWIALETFTGAGAQGQIFNRAYDLPPAGRHPNFRVRFRQTGGSGAPWDYWHVDDVCFDLSTDPVLQVTKIAQTLWDPFNGSTNPKAVPGATVLYTISVTNQGLGTVDGDSLAVTDTVPADTSLYVDTSGGDPIVFIDGPTSSGLTFTYAIAATFSNQPGGGPPYTYVPVPDAQGFDPAITGFRINPTGAMNAASGGNTPSFNLQVRVRVE